MLPEAATKLLKSTKFLHLATTHNDFPHISLMNYTFYQEGDVDYVIITTPRDSIKYENMINNPKVSMLVHDWVSSRNDDDKEPKRRNSLFELITNLNKTELNSVSVMINGDATVISSQEDESRYKFLKSLHLNNDSIDPEQIDHYVKDDTNELILISLNSCKITDTNNRIQEY